MTIRKQVRRASVTFAVMLLALASLVLASPAHAATVAVGSLSGPLTAGGTVTLTAQFDVEAGTTPLPSQLSARLVSNNPGTTGTLTFSGGTGSAGLSGCTTTPIGADCLWPAVAEGQSATITASLSASSDASGAFLIDLGEVVAGAFIPLGSIFFSVAVAPPTLVTGDVSVPAAALAGVPAPGFGLSAAVDQATAGSELPVRLGVQLTRQGGDGTVTLTNPSGLGLTGCLTDVTSVTCDWPAAGGSATSLDFGALFSDVSVWSLTGFYVNGDGLRIDFPDEANINVGVAPPTDPVDEAPDAPRLADSGTRGGLSVVALLASGALLFGTLLISARITRPAKRL